MTSGLSSRSGGHPEPPAKRPRQASTDDLDVFALPETPGQLYIAAQTATVEWKIQDFPRRARSGGCLDGPKFGPRGLWQIFCHPDGRCFNLPQGGPPGVFLRYLGPHERVPAYATIEKLVGGVYRVPENNTRESPFVVIFGRCEIEEWGVCKDFGLFDEEFAADLVDEALMLRARITWIEPRPDSLLPREVVNVRRLRCGSDNITTDFAALWLARHSSTGGAVADSTGPSARPLPPGDVVLLAEGQRFEADRVVLAARSSFFAGMLSFREGTQREVELPVPSRSLQAILRFAYTDESPELRSYEEAVELLEASSQLCFPTLVQLCGDHLRDTWLSLENVVHLLRVADQHGASSLRAEALATLGAHFEVVKATSHWEELLQNGMNPMLIQDMLQAVQAAAISAGRASLKM